MVKENGFLFFMKADNLAYLYVQESKSILLFEYFTRLQLALNIHFGLSTCLAAAVHHIESFRVYVFYRRKTSWSGVLPSTLVEWPPFHIRKKTGIERNPLLDLVPLRPWRTFKYTHTLLPRSAERGHLSPSARESRDKTRRLRSSFPFFSPLLHALYFAVFSLDFHS